MSLQIFACFVLIIFSGLNLDAQTPGKNFSLSKKGTSLCFSPNSGNCFEFQNADAGKVDFLIAVFPERNFAKVLPNSRIPLSHYLNIVFSRACDEATREKAQILQWQQDSADNSFCDKWTQALSGKNIEILATPGYSWQECAGAQCRYCLLDRRNGSTFQCSERYDDKANGELVKYLFSQTSFPQTQSSSRSNLSGGERDKIFGQKRKGGVFVEVKLTETLPNFGLLSYHNDLKTQNCAKYRADKVTKNSRLNLLGDLTKKGCVPKASAQEQTAAPGI